MTKTAKIKSSDNPKEFFEALNLVPDEQRLCASLLSMCEMGRVVEKTHPETYKLMVDRLDKEFGDGE